MGALPKNCTVNDVIKFPSDAAKWLGESEAWCVEHQDNLPGVIIEGQRSKKFHPATYIEVRTRKWRRTV